MDGRGIQEEAYVVIRPDKTEYLLPGVSYHFYNTDGKTPHLCLECDGKGNFEGVIPAGAYRVIATNLNAKGVEFKQMNSHTTARVYALSEEGGTGRTASSRTILAQPYNVYSVVLTELVVAHKDTVLHEPKPTLVTKTLRLLFTLQDGLEAEVAEMDGVLYGVYPFVHLYTCQPTKESLDASPDMAVSFTTYQTDEKRQADITLFGIRNPEGGVAYENELMLTLTMNDGTTHEVPLDLTETLTDVMEQYEGTIPVQLSVPIEIKKTFIGIEGEVTGWIDEGES